MEQEFKISEITVRNADVKSILTDFTIDTPDTKCTLSVRLAKKDYTLSELQKSALLAAIGTMQTFLDMAGAKD